jgi:hypothetical protein
VVSWVCSQHSCDNQTEDILLLFPCPAPSRSMRSSLASTGLQALAHYTLSKVEIFQKADQGWRSANPGRYFTGSFLATLPSHWASQVLGHNLTVSWALHLKLGIGWTRPLKLRTIPIIATAAHHAFNSSRLPSIISFRNFCSWWPHVSFPTA